MPEIDQCSTAPRKMEMGKCLAVKSNLIIHLFNPIYFRISNNPSTPGGRPVSPIAEEGGSEDLDRMVTEVRKLQEQQGGEKVMQNLVKQLRDLIAQWDWAQARHRHVAKIVKNRGK